MTPGFSLASQPLVAFVATQDPARAILFYRDTLGLPLLSEDRFALVFNAHGTMLRVAMVPDFTPAKFTVLGWKVADIAAAVEQLSSAGVTFERYGGMGQDERGVWTAPSGAKVAWFKDADGNVL